MSGVKNAIVLDVAPTMIDREKMDEAAAQFIKSHKKALMNGVTPYWVMLIGGDGSGYSYSKEDYKAIAESLLILAKKYQIRWLLTTSRRTNLSNEKVIKGILNSSDEVAHTVYFNESPEKVMQAYLGLGDFIFCTEDSTSMVSEAVISQKPVISLRSTVGDINKGHHAVIKRFAEKNYIYRMTIDELNTFSPDDIRHESINPDKNIDQIIDIAKASI